jgi:hypothetical protein
MSVAGETLEKAPERVARPGGWPRAWHPRHAAANSTAKKSKEKAPVDNCHGCREKWREKSIRPVENKWKVGG